MILPGHLAAGFLTASAILHVTSPELAPVQANLLLAFGTLAGDFPDVDVFYNMLKHRAISPKGLDEHRDYLTHAPAIWLVAGLTIFFFASSPFYKLIGLLTWLGPWSHFLCDSIEIGVMWLWPFSRKRYALRKELPPRETGSSSDWINLLNTYRRLYSFYAEAALVIIAIIVLML